jgi:hypothetical protein
MTTRNFAAALHSFDHRIPFQPFLVELVSGEQFRIVHPEAISLRGDMIVFITPKKRYHLFDSGSICQLMDPPVE